jgi:hypothetical protein
MDMSDQLARIVVNVRQSDRDATQSGCAAPPSELRINIDPAELPTSVAATAITDPAYRSALVQKEEFASLYECIELGFLTRPHEFARVP